MYLHNGTHYPTIDDLEKDFDCDYLDRRKFLVRVATAPEDSAWYCEECGSTDTDSYNVICNACDEGDDEYEYEYEYA